MTQPTSLMTSDPRYNMLLRIWNNKPSKTYPSSYKNPSIIRSVQFTAHGAAVTAESHHVGGGGGRLYSPPGRSRQSYLRCHDEAGSGGVDGDVAGHQAHILELFVHLPVLLVAQGLDRAGEDDPLLLPECQGDGVPGGGRVLPEAGRYE